MATFIFYAKKVILALSVFFVYLWNITNDYELEIFAVFGMTILTIFLWKKVSAKYL